ncbi:ZIP family metal transporter [Candidatus Pacearchaeota archaeon]|nr:MAG: ZIP family metal transporter [Candidatus Pacearchaeota archaeon]
MANEFLLGIVSVISVSLISFIGILFFFKKKTIGLLKFIVAFSAGSLLAASFFHLIPEGISNNASLNFVLIGILGFYLLEAMIHWHHRHDKECVNCVSPTAYLNLIGDAIHNFIDGVIIMASFLIGHATGIATTISIILHEIPQEVGDFGVLINSGFSRKKALFLNFISALFSLIGGISAFFFLGNFESYIPSAVLFAAGGFIYIATTDLFPELHREKNSIKIIIQFIAVILGIILIGLLP